MSEHGARHDPVGIRTSSPMPEDPSDSGRGRGPAPTVALRPTGARRGRMFGAGRRDRDARPAYAQKGARDGCRPSPGMGSSRVARGKPPHGLSRSASRRSSRIRVEGNHGPPGPFARIRVGPRTLFIRASGWRPSRRAYARREGGGSGTVVVRRRLVPPTRGGVRQKRHELVPAFARSAYARREAKREHGGSGAARLVPPVRGGKRTCAREEDRAEARPRMRGGEPLTLSARRTLILTPACARREALLEGVKLERLRFVPHTREGRQPSRPAYGGRLRAPARPRRGVPPPREDGPCGARARVRAEGRSRCGRRREIAPIRDQREIRHRDRVARDDGGAGKVPEPGRPGHRPRPRMGAEAARPRPSPDAMVHPRGSERRPLDHRRRRGRAHAHGDP